jgi:hypothetical protein
MSIRDTIQGRVAAHNARLRQTALVQGAIGLVSCLVTCGGVFGLAYGACMLFLGSWGGGGALLVALVATVLFAAATLRAALQRADPLASLSPLSETERLATRVSLFTPGFVYVNPRYLAAGCAGVLISGPTNLLDARNALRRRLPQDEGTIDAAVEALALAAEEPRLPELPVPLAAVVLRRVDLVKLREDGEDYRVLLTGEGRFLLDAPDLD